MLYIFNDYKLKCIKIVFNIKKIIIIMINLLIL